MVIYIWIKVFIELKNYSLLAIVISREPKKLHSIVVTFVFTLHDSTLEYLCQSEPSWY